MINFNVYDWYWVVAGSTTQVYSSASGDYVPIADATYVAWLAEPDHQPNRAASEAELGEVLARYDLPDPVNANVLSAFRDTLVEKLPIKVLFKILFNHENRIRVNEGNSTISVAQFKTGIKSLL